MWDFIRGTKRDSSRIVSRKREYVDDPEDDYDIGQDYRLRQKYARYLEDMEEDIRKRSLPNNWEENPLYKDDGTKYHSLITSLGKGNMVVAGKTTAGKNFLTKHLLEMAVFNDGMQWSKIFIVSNTADLNDDFDFMEDPRFIRKSGLMKEDNLVRIEPSNVGELENYFEETKTSLRETKKNAKKKYGKKRARILLEKEKEKHKTLVIINDSQGSLRTTNKEDLICRMATYCRQMDWMMIIMTQSTRAIGPTLLSNIGYYILFSYNEMGIRRIEKETDIQVTNKESARKWLRTPKNAILLTNYWTHGREMPEKAILIPRIKTNLTHEREYK